MEKAKEGNRLRQTEAFEADGIEFESLASCNQGVFLVKMKNAFVPVKRDNSVNTYSRISTVPRGSERSE